MTILPPVRKRVTPKTHGVRYLGFYDKLYRYLTVYDARGDNGVSGEDDYCGGMNLTPEQEATIGAISRGEFALQVNVDGTVSFVTEAEIKAIVRRIS